MALTTNPTLNGKTNNVNKRNMLKIIKKKIKNTKGAPWQ